MNGKKRRKTFSKSGRKAKTKLIVIFAIFFVLIVGIILYIALRDNEAEGNGIRDDNLGSQYNDMIKLPPAAPNSEDYSDEYINIDTRYGNLHFPENFEEFLKVDLRETDKKTTVVFYCASDEEQVFLFSVSFGITDEKETKIGLIQTNKEVIDVNVYAADFTAKSEWEKEHADLIYGMIEAMNFVVDHLKFIEGYSPV